MTVARADVPRAAAFIGAAWNHLDPAVERILDAALERFELVGLRRTTVDDVARCAGVGRVTVYRRVGGKDDLVRAVTLREAERVLASVSAAIAPLGGARERTIEAFVVGMQTLRRNRLMRRLLKTEPEDLLPFVTLGAAQIIEEASGFMAAEIPCDPAVAELMIRLAQSLVLTPSGLIAGGDPERLRVFAERTLAPLVAAP
jgi:AcrR family transcriptional regulator